MFEVFGHSNVAVLDGGLPAYKATGGALECGPLSPPAPAGRPFGYSRQQSVQSSLVATIDQVVANMSKPQKDRRLVGSHGGVVAPVLSPLL
jgi:3-mercaptopyruvate sulfurtransferase SseA